MKFTSNLKMYTKTFTCSIIKVVILQRLNILT